MARTRENILDRPVFTKSDTPEVVLSQLISVFPGLPHETYHMHYVGEWKGYWIDLKNIGETVWTSTSMCQTWRCKKGIFLTVDGMNDILKSVSTLLDEDY